MVLFVPIAMAGAPAIYVIDDLGSPVQGAVVRTGEAVFLTDSSGKWTVDCASLDCTAAGQREFVVEAPGYLPRRMVLARPMRGRYRVSLTAREPLPEGWIWALPTGADLTPQGPVTRFDHLADLPAAERAAWEHLFVGGTAEPGAPWDPGCVRTDVPDHAFVAALSDGGRWWFVSQQGGFGVSTTARLVVIDGPVRGRLLAEMDVPEGQLDRVLPAGWGAGP
jgi:hypothetical protein